MKLAQSSYRVAVVGASSLLGKELISVLRERNFPVSRLVPFEADEEGPDLPIVDLSERLETIVADEDIAEAELDFAFLAARPRQSPAFLRRPGAGGARHCFLIDLSEGLEGPGERPGALPSQALSVPLLDRLTPARNSRRAVADTRLFVSPHPAVIVISTLLLRLAAHFSIQRAVANVFGPASEIGPKGIEELQKQTMNLLSFQKIPRAVFGTQLAFNVLPRLGRGRAGTLADLEGRIRHELRQYLGDRVPLPALRLFQAPVFYSLAFSLYVETAEPAAPEAVGRAVEGERVCVRRVSEQAPSQVEAAGRNDILVDAIAPDPDHPAVNWIWATADNLRLAAINAVEIAETLGPRVPSGSKKLNEE